MRDNPTAPARPARAALGSPGTPRSRPATVTKARSTAGWLLGPEGPVDEEPNAGERVVGSRANEAPFQPLPEEPHRSGRPERVERCAALAEGHQGGGSSRRGPDGPELGDPGEEPVTSWGPAPVHRPKEAFIQVSGSSHGGTAYRLAPGRGRRGRRGFPPEARERGGGGAS